MKIDLDMINSFLKSSYEIAIQPIMSEMISINKLNTPNEGPTKLSKL